MRGRHTVLASPHVTRSYPERVIWRRCLADNTDVRAGPLRCPAVDFALSAVGPGHVGGYWDRIAVVADVLPVQLPAPLVGCVLDGLPVHTSSVEQVFVRV